MKIVCPNCSTTYDVGATSIAPGGRDVRCSRCGTTWRIDPETIAESEDLSQFEDETVDWQEALAEEDGAASGEAEDDLAFEQAEVDDGWDEELSGAGDENEVQENDPDWAFVGAEDEESDDDASDDDDDWQNEIALKGGNDKTAADVAYSTEAPDENPADTGAAEAVESVEQAAKPARRWRRRRMSPRDAPGYRVSRQMRAAMGLALFAGSIVLGIAVVSLREPIVRMSPNLAELYAKVGLEVNLRGLEFRDLRTFREYDKGAPVLIVEGTVENVRNASAHVPAIRLSLRSGDAQEIYAWTVEPRQLWLRAGQTLRFSTRLASPPDVAADVLLRFTDRTRRQTDI
ncbi:zinc-ribbon domain-containing protein [Breoghania sp.]|uniref:zinc-ribbon domain-containing protein n=1 Tax=Breoghania sp. TaxID=2065378 RepID=UPI002AA8C2C7|nr:zinc-ribbon domain-containing protein [Breoghania sp.]